MAIRLTEQPVVDKAQYKGELIFVDKEGYVCKAEKKKPLSDAEREKRKRAKYEKVSAIRKQGVPYRNKIYDARLSFKEAVKREDQAGINKALDDLKVAQIAYQDWKKENKIP